MDTDALNRGKEHIEHYGVKGMKWGVRRSRKARALARARAKEEFGSSADHKLAKKLKGRKISSMSNEELQFLNTRLSLERNYANLNPSKGSRRQAKIEKRIKQIELAQKAWKMLPKDARTDITDRVVNLRKGKSRPF